jgi:hypothetical protein
MADKPESVRSNSVAPSDYSYDSQGHGGGIRPHLHTGVSRDSSQSPSQTHIATDGQSVSVGVEPRPYIYYSLTVTVLSLWGALSDERTGLSFVYATDPCQRSLSRA